MPEKKNRNLCTAKVRKQDEFYTDRRDIEKELAHYTESFQGKTVYCCADDPRRSAFWAFFHENFQALRLKRLIATFYGKDAYQMTYEGGMDADIASGICQKLQGDGDFLSAECQAILKESNIVCTNPPFSLFRAFFDAIQTEHKAFLLIGNLNAITAKNIFPFFQDDRIRLGYTFPKSFLRPDGRTQAFGNIGWFTNLQLEDLKHRPFWTTGKKLEEGTYPPYANCEGIDVHRIAAIPDDYDGIMGVPITILKYYNPQQFQIFGYSKYAPDNRLAIHPVPKELLDSFYRHGGTGHYTTKMRVLCYYDAYGIGHFPFERILIQRRPSS